MTAAAGLATASEAERIEAATRRYFELVDARAFDEMFELFDEAIVYERGGLPTIEGIAAFRSFYEGTRAIERGAHTVELLVVSPPWTIVRGRFEGILRSGEAVTIRFADFLLFGPDRILRRWSYFAGRSV